MSKNKIKRNLRKETNAKIGDKIGAEEIEDELHDDVVRSTQEYEKTNDKFLGNENFLENDITNEISHEHEIYVEKIEKRKILKEALNKSVSAVN